MSKELILGMFAATLIGLAAHNSRSMVLPDVITISGIIAGVVLSWFVPALHGKSTSPSSLLTAIQGLFVGAVVVYGLSVAGKVLFGKQNVALSPSSKVVLSQTALILPDHEIPYEQVFYRNSDQIEMRAGTAHLRIIEVSGEASRIFENVLIVLSPTKLSIGESSFDPSRIAQLEVTTDKITLPREAVGFGLVKLAGLIGVFLGWQGVLFAIGCGGGVLAVSYLLALAMSQSSGQSMDAATPMCVAAIVWMVFHSKIALAGSLAIVLGKIASIFLKLWPTHPSQ